MEARIAKLEADVEHIQADTREIKSDLRRLLWSGLVAVAVLLGAGLTGWIKLDDRLDAVAIETRETRGGVTAIDQRLGRIEARFDGVDARFDRFSADLEAIRRSVAPPAPAP